ncbi:CTP synthase [Candidatus Cytomitobacter indipagum]|uniref:CTP synthase (glutamine hydrolyzing) n=1 Tax=Candidatus Cytomitobacter indipagum TaxID=2601575 RepID=A0A5C0UDW1_9PROT|nr:CTP synthase [Candidatus Cytomitobacter indipagum]QEK38255.1 CTP synthase [Candidatus Cytomitobacter indipagum]
MSLKIIFITGGVMSGLGKGVTASMTALLLKKRGFKVRMRKLEPYLNVDAGTLSPDQHGEVFVTEDGTETDMDIGNYERFAGVTCTKDDYITSGKIFSEVIQGERRGDYLGETVQIIPHVTNMIMERITSNIDEDTDFLICEIGGTVGDIEGLSFLESIRQKSRSCDVMYLHIGLMPFLKKSEEFKTKPIQHSVSELQKFGIKPDIILCRSTKYYGDLSWKKKIAMFANLDEEMVFPAWDQESLYDVLEQYYEDGLDAKICKFFKQKMTKHLTKQEIGMPSFHYEKNIRVALITKYNKINDSYCSVIEAVKHAAMYNRCKADVVAINSDCLATEELKEFDCIIVPGGFGGRGTEGKINALQFARENDIPCLGICLGMQLMVIEGLRNVVNIDSNSSEFCKNIENPAIGLIDECMENVKGGTMRLGQYPCKMSGKMQEMYKDRLQDGIVSERHRHRYEVNHLHYREALEKVFNLSAWSPDNILLEGFEIKDHSFYVGVQFHPEFQTYLNNPHPLFDNLIKAGLNKQN